MYDFIWPSMNVWGEWVSKGNPDIDRSRNWAAEMNPADAILTSPSVVYGMGDSWPEVPISAELLRVQPSSVETLLVNGNIDYSTPPQSINKILPMLRKGQHVILSEFGHTGDFWRYQPKARLQLLTSFYNTGIADNSLYTHRPMKFSVGIKGSFPSLAKIFISAILILIIIVIILLWFVIRFMRRREYNRKKTT